MKFSGLDKDEKAKVQDEVVLNAIPVAGDRWESSHALGSGCPDYGLCKTCKNGDIYQKKYSGWIGRCCMWKRYLNHQDPVIECNQYDERGKLDIEGMTRIAYLIEPGKNKIGLT